MKGFVAVVGYGRTVQSDIYIGHNFIIANFRLRCSQHWETLLLIVHHLVGHLQTHRNLILISTQTTCKWIHQTFMESRSIGTQDESIYDVIVGQGTCLTTTARVWFINSV